MKTYRYCREVKAFRIKEILEATAYDSYGQPIRYQVLVPEDHCCNAILVDDKYMHLYRPEKGGWYIHGDGESGPQHCSHEFFNKHYECYE